MLIFAIIASNDIYPDYGAAQKCVKDTWPNMKTDISFMKNIPIGICIKRNIIKYYHQNALKILKYYYHNYVNLNTQSYKRSQLQLQITIIEEQSTVCRWEKTSLLKRAVSIPGPHNDAVSFRRCLSSTMEFACINRLYFSIPLL